MDVNQIAYQIEPEGFESLSFGPYRGKGVSWPDEDGNFAVVSKWKARSGNPEPTQEQVNEAIAHLISNPPTDMSDLATVIAHLEALTARIREKEAETAVIIKALETRIKVLENYRPEAVIKAFEARIRALEQKYSSSLEQVLKQESLRKQ